MKASNAAAKFPIPFGNAADPADIRPIPLASQIGIQNGAASLQDGFPPNCFVPVAAGGAPPFGQDFNGLLNQITAWNQWQQAGAPIVYDATFQSNIGGYPMGAVVQVSASGPSFMSMVDNNTVAPAVGATGWMPVPTFGGNLTSVTATTTLTAANAGLIIVNALSGNITITMPAVASENGVPLLFEFARGDSTANTVTLTGSGSNVFWPGGAPTFSLAGNSSAVFSGNGSTQWLLTGGSSLVSNLSPSSLTANGFKKYPDPNSPTGFFIEQWGSVNLGTAPNQPVTLPVAFPNSFLNCVCSYGAFPPTSGSCGSSPSSLTTIAIGNSAASVNQIIFKAWGF
jgi:hypothetical protein